MNIDDSLTELEKSENPMMSTHNDVYNQVKDIPFEEIRYYVGESAFKSVSNKMITKKNIQTLGDLYLATFVGNLKFEEAGRQWKQLLADRVYEILTGWRAFKDGKTFPVEICGNEGLLKNLKRAFREVSQEISLRLGNRRYKSTLVYPSIPKKTFSLSTVESVLRNIYNEDKSVRETASLLDITYEMVRSVHADTTAALVAGDTISDNISLHPDLIAWAQNVRDRYLFHPLDELASDGDDYDMILPTLNLDYINLAQTGINIVIPKDKKGIYSKVGDAFVSVLRDKVVAVEKEEIIEEVDNHKKVKKIDDYDTSFIESLLGIESLVETEDDKFKLNQKFLLSDQQKMARIIYDCDSPITTQYAKDKFEALYNHTYTGSLSTLKKYGIDCKQYGLWEYGAQTLMPIQSFVREFAEKNKIFYYKDLEKAMIETGYTIPPSIRTFITNVCLVDNEDRNHFCLRSCNEDYQEISWRLQNRIGLTNWVLNKVKDCFADKEKMHLEQIYDFIRREAQGTDYDNRIRYRAQHILYSNCGEGLPFLRKDEYVRKNHPIFEQTDFSIVGLKGGKYPFYIQIRSFILNEAKKWEEDKKPLTEVLKEVNNNLDEHQERNTLIRAINNQHLPEIGLKLENIDGVLYIVRTSQQTVAEPVFELKSTADTDVAEMVEETVIAANRPEISYRLKLDWKQLTQVLLRELSFYRGWMLKENIVLEDAIDKFALFMENSPNTNLSFRVPQSLYEYWFAKTDYSDRETYIINMALYFEALLCEIWFNKHKERLRLSGLGSWMNKYAGLSSALTLPPNLARGFDRIYRDIYSMRNRIAHGEAVDMSSADMARTISDYAALYIVTIAKYL